MIASGALGTPRIFRESNCLLEGKECPQCGWEEKRESFMQYYSLAGKHGVAAPKRLRAQAIEWVAGFHGVKGIRRKLNAAKTEEEIRQAIEDFSPIPARPR
jgi:tRNA-dihydrouridine synthase